ncbi:LOW QUALITY PROTEIN: G2/mitotic-specific cyclin-2-like [Primulina tabacum]|uniref:LOW QUALITY PROTEIN: G2/mitotic-specific cyclin-2-like n=1 Tax=Primulina tabacum TaxID=48773 RepID=UPI003F5A69A8
MYFNVLGKTKGVAEMGRRKFGVEIRPNRRALSVLNQNLSGVNPNPCVINKRGLPEINGVRDKNAQVPAHRPITRKYASQMTFSHKHFPEESKKPKTSANELTVWEDISLTDSEDQLGAAKDQPVPMFYGFEITENHQTKEVEMEDIFEDTILDIDGCDSKDPLAMIEYVEDLYVYYKKIESSCCVLPGYMAQQFDINEKMRSILIDWLIEVHHKFELRDETLFLTVNLIDRFLEKKSVVRKKLQLVGLVALLLACKYEEVSVPVVDDLIFISDKAYTRNEIIEMERLMLNTLQFNMSVPTAYVFLERFLKAAQSDRKLETLSFFLIELCLVEYEMLKYPPSFMAAAATYTAQASLYGIGQWNKTCQHHTGYSEGQLMECSRIMVGFHQLAGTGKLTGVHRKYNTSKFGYAARWEPAHFLVQTPSPQ